MNVFLGGTCSGSTWREALLKMLDLEKINCYNPVVPEWTEECRVAEEAAKSTSDYNLYVITPEMTGVYSIYEATVDTMQKPEKTIFCLLFESPIPCRRKSELSFDPKHNIIRFETKPYHSLYATANALKKRGANVFFSLSDVATFLNDKAGE